MRWASSWLSGAVKISRPCLRHSWEGHTAASARVTETVGVVTKMVETALVSPPGAF